MERTDKEPFGTFKLNDAPVVKLANAASFVVLICVALLIAWMVVTPVDEVAKARGSVEPTSELQRIQSEYGGAVAVVHVRKGDIVSAGDLLVEFDQSDAETLLHETRVKEFSLLLEQERLRALVESRSPDFESVKVEIRMADDYAGRAGSTGRGPALSNNEVKTLIEREMAAWRAQVASLESAQQVIERQIKGKQADLESIQTQRPAVERQRAVAQEQVATQQSLGDRGLARRPELIAAIEAEADFDFQLASLTGRQAVIEAEIEELHEQIEDVLISNAADARARITASYEEYLEVEQQILRHARRLDATTVHAPVAGVIQTIPETVVGRIVEAGGLVAEIVPQDVGLRFAGQLAPRDVGFVSVGQLVNIKVDAFDFGRFGALSGTVTEISATTIVNPQGVAYYEVLVDIPRPFFREDAKRFGLLPGMTGEIDILTGKKTVFEYVWKPIYTNLDLALTER